MLARCGAGRCGSAGHTGSVAWCRGWPGGHKPTRFPPALLRRHGRPSCRKAAWGRASHGRPEHAPPAACPHETGGGKWAGDRASSRSPWAVVSRCSQVAVSFTTLPFSVLTVKGGGLASMHPPLRPLHPPRHSRPAASPCSSSHTVNRLLCR